MEYPPFPYSSISGIKRNSNPKGIVVDDDRYEVYRSIIEEDSQWNASAENRRSPESKRNFDSQSPASYDAGLDFM